MAEVKGLLRGIEARLADREKLTEATIALRVRDEVEKATAKPPRAPRKPT